MRERGGAEEEESERFWHVDEFGLSSSPDYFVENVLRCALPFVDKGEISEA